MGKLMPERKYHDVYDREDAIFVICPDGTVLESENGQQAHASLISYEILDKFPTCTFDGWCRGFVLHDQETIEFYPFSGWNLGYELDEDGNSYDPNADGYTFSEGEYYSRLTKYTPLLGEKIAEIIPRHARPGYEVHIEFEDRIDTYIYKGDDGES